MKTEIIKDLELKFKSVYSKEIKNIEDTFEGYSRGGTKTGYINGIHQVYRIEFLKEIINLYKIEPTHHLLNSLSKGITGKVSSFEIYKLHFNILTNRTNKIKKIELLKISNKDMLKLCEEWALIDTRLKELFSPKNLKKIALLREKQKDFLNSLVKDKKDNGFTFEEFDLIC